MMEETSPMVLLTEGYVAATGNVFCSLLNESAGMLDGWSNMMERA